MKFNKGNYRKVRTCWKKRPSITALAFHSQLYADTFTDCVSHKSRAQEKFCKDGSDFKSGTTNYCVT